MMPTYVETFQHQADFLMSTARSLDTRGYAVIVQGMNRDGAAPRFPFRYIAGAIPEIAKTTGPRSGVIIHLHVDVRLADDVHAGKIKVVDAIAAFSFRLPNRVRYRHILAALELASTTTWTEWIGGREQVSTRFVKGKQVSYTHMVGQQLAKRSSGNGPLQAERHADYVSVRGTGRTQLEMVVHLFDAPHNRAVLLGGK